MTITDALLGEHGAIRPLLDSVAKTSSTDGAEAIRSRVLLLRDAVISHADIEDELLRPAIEQWLPPVPAGPDGEAPPTDHQRIRAGLTRAAEAEDPGAALRELSATVREIWKHFEKEESIVFPLATARLSRRRQEELGAEWAARRKIVAGRRGSPNDASPPEA